MFHHLIQNGIRVFRVSQLNDFHFVKLMQSVQSPDIFSVRSGFTSETWRISCHFYRQIIHFQYCISENIGQRHLCRWDHVVIIQPCMIHLIAFIRQLSRTVTGIFINHDGRHDFFVTGPGILIQEKLYETHLQPGTFSFVYRKTCPGQLNAQIKINQIVFFCQLPMRQGPRGKIGNHSSFPNQDVVIFPFTGDHKAIWYIWQSNEQLAKFFFQGLLLLIQFFDRFFCLCSLLFNFFCLGFLPFLH